MVITGCLSVHAQVLQAAFFYQSAKFSREGFQCVVIDGVKKYARRLVREKGHFQAHLLKNVVKKAKKKEAGNMGYAFYSLRIRSPLT